MTRIGVIKEVYERTPYIYAIAETHQRAEAIAHNAWLNGVQKNCQYFVRTIPDNACIGDDL
jgi:hypothetical protein